MAHGIDTTIVEIDPIVFEYAIKYFGLPEGHTPVIEDAVSYASYLAQNTTQTFDYIVHDVFTGGAEPVDLFTVEFMTDLYSLLKPNGVAAIVCLKFPICTTKSMLITPRTMLETFSSHPPVSSCAPSNPSSPAAASTERWPPPAPPH